MNKIAYLESIRGIAALVVVNEHLLKFFFFLAFSNVALRSDGFGVIEELSYPPFNLLHNGAWAVCLFFVLSGYVLSYRFFSDTGHASYRGLLGKVVARYVRLALPVFASLLVIYLIMKGNGVFFAELIEITQTGEKNTYTDVPGLMAIFQQGFGSALFLGDSRYNPPLWTMVIEMVGSIGVFIVQAIFLSFRDKRHAWVMRMVVYGCLIILFFPTLYVAFVLGMLLCDCKNHDAARQFLERYARYWVPVSLLLGVLLCSYMIRGLYTNPYRLITFGEFNPFYEYLYNIWGAFFLLAGICFAPSIQRVLSASFLKQLGAISFPLYLTHYIVLVSFTSYVFLTLPIDYYLLRVSMAIGISLPVIFLFAFLFERGVNQPAMKVANYFKDFVFVVGKR